MSIYESSSLIFRIIMRSWCAWVSRISQELLVFKHQPIDINKIGKLNTAITLTITLTGRK